MVLDHGSGNLRSAERALARAGADVTVTADLPAASEADGLVVPGVGAFAACMAGIDAVRGGTVVWDRLRKGRPVLGICVGMQVLFETGVEQERFYFVHSYAARHDTLAGTDALVTTSEHGTRFAAAVERGALSATQFHPEKSGDAGAALLRNWVDVL